MTIEFTGRKIEITPALRSFTEKKLSKLDRYLDGITEAHVILRIEKHRHSAEIIVNSRRAKLSGSETTEDLYASVGKVIEKLERQAQKLKDKRSWGKKKVKGVSTIRAVRAESEPEPPAAAASGAGAPRLIRTRRYAVKPMTADEAVMQLQGSRDAFVVYRDARNQRISVVFLRPDGNFGLVEPDI